MTDQFGSTSARLKKPYYLCNPVQKNGAPVLNPTQHLVCYKSEDTPPLDSSPPQSGNQALQVTNQFGQIKLAARRICSTSGACKLRAKGFVCVPSTKTVLP